MDWTVLECKHTVSFLLQIDIKRCLPSQFLLVLNLCWTAAEKLTINRMFKLSGERDDSTKPMTEKKLQTERRKHDRSTILFSFFVAQQGILSTSMIVWPFVSLDYLCFVILVFSYLPFSFLVFLVKMWQSKSFERTLQRTGNWVVDSK